MRGVVNTLALSAALLPGLASAQDITFWNQGDATVAAFSEAAAESFREATGTGVDVQIYPNEAYKTVMQVAMGAGNQPDVFFNWGGEDTFRYVRTGQLRDISAMVDPAGLPKAQLTPYTLGDGVYGVPLTQHTVMFFFNLEMFERFGVEPPETVDELAGVCRAIRAQDPDFIPITLGAKEPWTIVHYLTMLFTRFVPDEVRVADDTLSAADADLYTHPGYFEGFAALRQLLDAKCFNRGINSVSPEEARAFFGAEISAMTFCGTWCLDPLDREGMVGRYGLFPMPGIPGAAGDQEAAFIVVEGLQVAANSKSPEAAEAFLAHMVSADVQGLMVRELGRLPVNADALAMADTTEAFDTAVRALTDAPRTVMPLDMTMDNSVGQALYNGGQEFVNRTKTAEEVMDGLRRAAVRARARRARMAESDS